MNELNAKQIETLQYILDNSEEKLEEPVIDQNRDVSIVKGIVKFIIGKQGNLDLLSSKQLFYYKGFISPLLVPECDGIYGTETCTGNGVVDEPSLLISYMEEDMLCQHCRYDRDKNEKE